jgi:hypothetical protein
MPAVYDKMGITFQYPENWELDERDALQGERGVTVYSPGGAFWSVLLQPANVDPMQAARTALAALRKEYELDAEEARETIGPRELVGYDANFYYVDLTNTAYIRALRTPSTTYLILCQAEDGELREVEAVFRAMTTSLIRSLD